MSPNITVQTVDVWSLPLLARSDVDLQRRGPWYRCPKTDQHPDTCIWGPPYVAHLCYQAPVYDVSGQSLESMTEDWLGQLASSVIKFLIEWDIKVLHGYNVKKHIQPIYKNA